jgi:hypothetical protein
MGPTQWKHHSPAIYIQKPPTMDIEQFLHSLEHNCEGIQLYLNNEDDTTYEHWCRLLETLNLERYRVIIHLPDEYTLSYLRTGKLLAGEFGIFVHHYQPEQRLQPLPWGILGVENARFGVQRDYHDRWVAESSKVGRIPVFDIPRLFKNTQTADAVAETNRLLGLMDHYLLHLIDFNHPRQNRSDFVPFGHGLLTDILPNLQWTNGPVAIVLEFEQIEQSLSSIPFIRALF